MGAEKPGKDLQAHDAAILALAWSPADSLVATGAQDGSVGLWNADSGKSLGRFVLHGAAVNALAFTRDGRYLVSGGEDRDILITAVAARDQESLLALLDLHARIGMSFALDDQGRPVPRDPAGIARERLEAARRGSLSWRPDGGKELVPLYETLAGMAPWVQDHPVRGGMKP